MTTAETTITHQIDRIAEALRARDLDGLKQLYAADVVSFDIDPPLRHVGVAAKLQNWKRVFTFFEEVDYEVRDLALTAGDDVAFGHFFGRLSGTLKTERRRAACGSEARCASARSTATG